jgi:hypothetical protein
LFCTACLCINFYISFCPYVYVKLLVITGIAEPSYPKCEKQGPQYEEEWGLLGTIIWRKSGVKNGMLIPEWSGIHEQMANRMQK